MAFYKQYKPRTFDPTSSEAFKVSRSKIDFFLDCPRCFYIEARHGVKRPSMPSFTLNIAVDTLLKKEFDAHRAAGTHHPLLEQYGLDLVPFRHTQMDTWRENFVGVQTLHQKTNLLVFGAVDDIWVDGAGMLYVVDYKATSKDTPVTRLDDTKWHNQYRRQMEVYQWLLRQNGFNVSNTGYFVYVNGKKDNKAFDAKLEFDVNLIPYMGSDAWIEQTLPNLKQCLMGPLPDYGEECEFCIYRKSMAELESAKQIAVPIPPAITAKTISKPKVPKTPKISMQQNQPLF